MKVLRILRIAGRLVFGFSLVMGFMVYFLVREDGLSSVQRDTSIPFVILQIIAGVFFIIDFYMSIGARTAISRSKADDIRSHDTSA